MYSASTSQRLENPPTPIIYVVLYCEDGNPRKLIEKTIRSKSLITHMEDIYGHPCWLLLEQVGAEIYLTSFLSCAERPQL
jgi:hypothetical protein